MEKDNRPTAEDALGWLEDLVGELPSDDARPTPIEEDETDALIALAADDDYPEEEDDEQLQDEDDEESPPPSDAEDDDAMDAGDPEDL